MLKIYVYVYNSDSPSGSGDILLVLGIGDLLLGILFKAEASVLRLRMPLKMFCGSFRKGQTVKQSIIVRVCELVRGGV